MKPHYLPTVIPPRFIRKGFFSLLEIELATHTDFLKANLARLDLPYPEAVFEINFFRKNPVPCKCHLGLHDNALI